MYKKEEKSIMTFLSEMKKEKVIELIWNNKVDVLCKIDTLYDDDNGLELEDEDYEEYHSCVLRIVRIKYVDNQFVKKVNLKDSRLKENELFEINYHNEPDIIRDNNGLVIWKKRS